MDDRLHVALGSLPRERAGAGFTAAVLRRLEEPRRQARSPARRPLLAAAAAVLLFAVALGAREWWHFDQRRRATARLAALEEQRQVLVAELAELRRQVAGAQPVVYLGGSNDLDLVLDLARAQRDGVRPEDIPRGLLQASRLGQPLGASAADWTSDGQILKSYGAPVDGGPAGGGVYPARLDERRTRNIY